MLPEVHREAGGLPGQFRAGKREGPAGSRALTRRGGFSACTRTNGVTQWGRGACAVRCRGVGAPAAVQT